MYGDEDVFVLFEDDGFEDVVYGGDVGVEVGMAGLGADGGEVGDVDFVAIGFEGGAEGIVVIAAVPGALWKRLIAIVIVNSTER